MAENMNANSPILDELEVLIQSAQRLQQDQLMFPMTEQEAAAYQKQYGPFELIIGPCLIRRIDNNENFEHLR